MTVDALDAICTALELDVAVVVAVASRRRGRRYGAG